MTFDIGAPKRIATSNCAATVDIIAKLAAALRIPLHELLVDKPSASPVKKRR